MGTAQPQDTVFNDIAKKTYEEMKFSDCLYQRVDISKVNLERLKPWINKKLTDSLHIENKVVTEFVCNQLQKDKFPCPKQLHINMTGFLTDSQAQQFMDELWAVLISAEVSESGIPAVCLEPENHKIAAKVGEEQQLPESTLNGNEQMHSSNTNGICNANNEDNTNPPIMECQSTQGDKSELSDGEIDESRSSCNRSRDRSERNCSSPDRKMNDSHEKQSQRRSRSVNRRSPKRRNQRYHSKHRNNRRYESPQRSRQSRSRFVEKRKASPSFIPASSKRNRSESHDSYPTQNGYRNEDTVARNPCNSFDKRSASHRRSKETSTSYLRSESRSTYRSSSEHLNYKRRASRSVSVTPSPERLQNNRGYNRDSSASSLERDSDRLQGGRRDDSRSRAGGFQYNRYRPGSPDRYDRYNRQELRSRQRSRSRQYSLSRNRSRSSRRSRSRFRQRYFSRNHSRSSRRSRSRRRSRPRYRQRSLSRNRSRSPRRFNGRRWPLQFRDDNRRRLNHWNSKRQSRERFGGRYDQPRYISPQRRFSGEHRFSPRRNQFRRNSPQWRDSPQRLSPERRSDLQDQNIFSPLQVSTPEYEDSTCNSWDQTKNSAVTMTPKQCPPSSNTFYKESREAGAEKRKYCDSEVIESVNSEAEEQYLAKKKPKKSKHNSDDYTSEVKSSKRKKKER